MNILPVLFLAAATSAMAQGSATTMAAGFIGRENLPFHRWFGRVAKARTTRILLDSMTDSIEVREAVLADAPEIIRLFALLGHTQPAGDDTARLGAFLDHGQHVLVASRPATEPGTALLGAVTLHITPVLHRAGPVGRLTAVIVDESTRGRGVGGALVSAAEDFLAAHGCALIEITSNKKRTDAHAFYERLGYIATSVRFAKPLPND
jgi:GNAT superfamily N-acetyltransferase